MNVRNILVRNILVRNILVRNILVRNTKPKLVTVTVGPTWQSS